MPTKGLTSGFINEFGSNLRVISLPIFDAPPRYLWFQLRNYSFFQRHLDKYDVVHGFCPEASALLIHFSRKLGKPFITSIHGTPLSELKAFTLAPVSEWTRGDFFTNHFFLGFPLYNTLIKHSLTYADHMITCSYFTLGEVRSIYHDINLPPATMIYNGVDLERIRCIDARNDRRIAPTIVFLGRLVWRKGLIYLLQAMTKVKNDFPDLKLKIFGRGPMLDRLPTLLTKLKLSTSVQVMGYVSYEVLIREIKMSNFAALPSLYEAQPISALEVMACRKPVLAFNFPFAREYIRPNYNGMLANPLDVDDLASKISLLLSGIDTCERMGDNAYEHVERYHNWEYQAEKYMNVYENVRRK